MDRLACVEIPQFPLQLLMQLHPEWGSRGPVPVVVVEEDKPNSPILWANAVALAHRITPGMRYAAALSLAGNLHGGVVAPDVVASNVQAIIEQLLNFTPHIEPARYEPGIFWLDAHGMELLQPSLGQWARNIHRALRGLRFHAVVVVGFSRFGTYAVAKALMGKERVKVFADRTAEAEMARTVGIEQLGIEPAVRESLEKLGIRTVAALTRLPADGLLERFGQHLFVLHQMAKGRYDVPLSPQRAEEPVVARLELDFPQTDWVPLLFLIGRMLEPLLATLKGRGQVLESLVVRRRLDRIGDAPEEQEDEIKVAVPTLDQTQILDLVRLRLEATPLKAGVTALALTAIGGRPHHDQALLFDPTRLEADSALRPPRDRKAADRALARLRAAFGNDAVLKVRLRGAHLPEAQFSWEPLEKTVVPTGPARSPPSMRPLVRRIFPKPVALPSRFLHEPDSWLLRGFVPGAVIRLMGPYVIQGGWWTGREVHREYHFVEMEHGQLLWIFYDRQRRRWFLQGQIE